jgi:hypothetical protein
MLHCAAEENPLAEGLKSNLGLAGPDVFQERLRNVMEVVLDPLPVVRRLLQCFLQFGDPR